MKILIIDDHAIFRAGLRQLLMEELSVDEAEEAGDAATGLQKIRAKDWDIVLLDISLPDRNGIDILKGIRSSESRSPVLMLSMFSDEQYAIRALRAGASGYLMKDVSTDVLIEAIKQVAAGGKYISASIAAAMADHLQGSRAGQQPHESLSDREYDIYIKLAFGNTVSEIAEQLQLSVKTVSTYRSRILKKMKMKNNSELMHYAFANNLIQS